jgi:hypothetical protein
MKGKEIPFASISIKKTNKGTTANSKGQYALQVTKGEYIVVCQNIGFKTNEKKINIEDNVTTLNFVLEEQEYELKEVVVSNKAEDPAYEIIRNAIKQRPIYLKEFNNFKCQVYLKGQLQLRDYPSKFLGDTVDFEDGDTSKAKERSEVMSIDASTQGSSSLVKRRSLAGPPRDPPRICACLHTCTSWKSRSNLLTRLHSPGKWT